VKPGISVALTDDVVVAVFTRARELGLLQSPAADTSWLTTEQAADYLGCSKGQVLNLVSEGRIPRRYQKGHKARFRRTDLDAYVEAA
jgi:excisionase family DNA binding protein